MNTLLFHYIKHMVRKKTKNLYPIEWPCRICEHDGEPFPDF